MVRITKDKNIYIKILCWGCAASGKTTVLDTLYNICREQDKDVVPTGNLVKIDMSSGATKYFDRGIFQSKKQNNIYFHCYTTGGQTKFQSLRKKVFMGTDVVIFVADSQRSRLQDNFDSLKELKRVAGDELIKKIPMFVMLNKSDLDDLISIEEWESLMREEGLLFERKHPHFNWNSIIYETIALYDINRNIYKVFSEVFRIGGSLSPEPIPFPKYPDNDF